MTGAVRRARARELLPALGARLSRHPRLLAPTLAALRRVPGARLRSAVYRRVSTPLALRMAARLDVPIPGGARLRVDTRDVTGRMLATSGVWEPHVTAVFRDVLRPGDVCVDVGANIGYFTLLAARLVGPAGHVHALEPADEARAELLANLVRNGAANVTVHPVAAGAADTEEPLWDPQPGVNAGQRSFRRRPSTGPQTTEPTTVAVRPLADLLPEEHLARVRLVKVDVEGYEPEVLAGLAPVLAAGHRPHVLVEVHPNLAPDAPAAVAALCRAHGLAPFRIPEPAGDRLAAAGRPALRPLTPEQVAAIRDPLAELLLVP